MFLQMTNHYIEKELTQSSRCKSKKINSLNKKEASTIQKCPRTDGAHVDPHKKYYVLVKHYNEFKKQINLRTY